MDVDRRLYIPEKNCTVIVCIIYHHRRSLGPIYSTIGTLCLDHNFDYCWVPVSIPLKMPLLLFMSFHADIIPSTLR